MDLAGPRSEPLPDDVSEEQANEPVPQALPSPPPLAPETPAPTLPPPASQPVLPAAPSAPASQPLHPAVPPAPAVPPWQRAAQPIGRVPPPAPPPAPPASSAPGQQPWNPAGPGTAPASQPWNPAVPPASQPWQSVPAPAQPSPASQPWYPAGPGTAPTVPPWQRAAQPAGPASRPWQPLAPRETAPSPIPDAGPEPEPSVATASASIFRVERARLLAIQELNWRRLRLVLWVVVVGVALGVLLLIPQVHALPMAAAVPTPPRSSPPQITHPGTLQRPAWAGILLVIGIGAPLLALALAVLALPLLLWREARLRRQRDLHLALGRQGLLFFLPGQPRHWFLLPWEHLTAVSDATRARRNGKRLRLRTVLWRRLARLQRAFRHGRQLGGASHARRPAVSPFTLHARSQQPRRVLRLTCYARLPGAGYGWLFRLNPFTRRAGPTTFLLETGWFEAARPTPPDPGAAGAQPRTAAAPPPSLHRILLALWQAAPLRAQRPALPLPRSAGAVILNTPAPGPGPGPEARRVDGAAWAALPLVPAISVVGIGIALALLQPIDLAAWLNLATLSILALGLGLLLAGAARPQRGRRYAWGAALLGLAGALNLAYALNRFLFAWLAAFQSAPGQPFLYLELLAGLFILLGASALGLEGAGRPGARPAASRSALANGATHAHGAELALALGLLLLGLARPLEDVNQAVMSDSAGALQLLRNILAEPLLPLAVLGLSYFAPLAGPALQRFLRALQMIYGLALALLVPLAFTLVYRLTGGTRPLPLEWTPLLVLALICGLVIALNSLTGHATHSIGQ